MIIIKLCTGSDVAQKQNGAKFYAQAYIVNYFVFISTATMDNATCNHKCCDL